MATLEEQIARIKNELSAQKIASSLPFSTLLYPENIPEIFYTDTVGLDFSIGVEARYRFRFERSDGKADVPLVDFAFEATTSPTYLEYVEEYYSQTRSGDDPDPTNENLFTGYVAEAGAGYVDFYIDVSVDAKATFSELSFIEVSLSVQAISPVAGILSVGRLQ